MAVYCDFENVALGVRDEKYDEFDIKRVLERLLVKGSIVAKKAYCDWTRYQSFKKVMHEAAFELIDIPHVRQSGKNSADIRMVVDALDLCYTKQHVDTFVIISGDSDFSPLVSKLRENNKAVIGVGVKSSCSDLLVNNCDEFIYYDDLVRESQARSARRSTKKKRSGGRRGGRGRGQKATQESGQDTANDAIAEAQPSSPPSQPSPAAAAEASEAVDPYMTEDERLNEEDRQQEAIDIVLETLEELEGERGEGEKVWGSMIKQTLKRRRPGFNESYYGFRSFNRLLEEAEERRYVELELDERSGGYLVSLDAGDD